MAEMILSPVANEVLKTITSLVISEISLAKGVKNDLNKLEKTLTTIKAVLMDAEAQQAKNHEVRDWLEKLKDVVYEVEDVLDEFSTEALRRNMEVKGSMPKEISNFLSPSNSIVYHFKLGHKIKEIRERLDNISTDRSKFHFREQVPDVRVENRVAEQTYSFVRVSGVIGRKNDKENIVKHLLSSSVGDTLSVIPLVGLGGLGKTTLAQLAYNDDRISRHFDLKMWVCVSLEFDKKKIVEKILKCINIGNYGNLELEQMILCLHDNLATKRFLLVLDDVWNEDKNKWTELKDLLMDGVSGSKIVVTTRSMKVARIMGGTTFSPYELQGLSNGECLSILMRCAFEEGHEKAHPKLLEIGKAIVRKCGGNPLAVVTLGCMLYMKVDEREWFDVRDNEIWTFQQKENDILPALRISYEQLPSYLKQCFSYCSVFPKDFIFARRDLINFWMAHGLLQSLDSNCRLEDIGNRYLNELLSRSFFQDSALDFDSTIYSCKMHDLVHDLAQMVAGAECLDVNFNTTKISERVRHVSFTETDLSTMEFPRSLLNAKNLRSFVLAYQGGNINKAFLDKLISTFKCLRFLDLADSQFEELPDFVGNLKHLRSLALSRNCNIKALTNSICKLLNLQSLYLDGCEQLQHLPKDFGKLISLRHLELTSKLISLPEKGLQGLTSLQFLLLYKCNHLASLSEGIRYLTSLRELHIVDCPSLPSLPNGMKCLTSLEHLGFRNCEELNLLEGEEDMQGLRNLRTLFIGGLPKLQVLPKGLLQSAYSTLQYLWIDNCQGLTTLPEWMQTLTSLQKLYIDNCHNLMSLPVGIQQLTNLQVLKIIGSPHLIKRCNKENGEDWPKISHVPQIFYT